MSYRIIIVTLLGFFFYSVLLPPTHRDFFYYFASLYFQSFTIVPCFPKPENLTINSIFFFCSQIHIHTAQKHWKLLSALSLFVSICYTWRAKHNILSMCILTANWYRGKNSFPSKAPNTSLEFGFFSQNVFFLFGVVLLRALAGSRSFARFGWERHMKILRHILSAFRVVRWAISTVFGCALMSEEEKRQRRTRAGIGKVDGESEREEKASEKTKWKSFALMEFSQSLFFVMMLVWMLSGPFGNVRSPFAHPSQCLRF